MASVQHRCVFVGNIPYDAAEEDLIRICEEVGPVVSFRLVVDRDTGKPKGYGFCEYKDEETALSARRNLQGYEINGRQLRVDFAENEKGTADRNRDQGRGGPGLVDLSKQTAGPKVARDLSLHQPVGFHAAVSAAGVMSGILGSPQMAIGSSAVGVNGRVNMADPLTTHLAGMSRFQLFEILHLMKGFIQQNQQNARQVLAATPQLAKALLQAQIILGCFSQMFPRSQNGQLSPMIPSQGQAHIPNGGQQIHPGPQQSQSQRPQNFAFHMFPPPTQQQSSTRPSTLLPPQLIQVPPAPLTGLPQGTQPQLPLQPPLPQTRPPSPRAAQAVGFQFSRGQQPLLAQESSGIPPPLVGLSYQAMPPPLPSQPLPQHIQSGLMVSTNSSVGNIAQLGRGASTEMLNSSAPFANWNQLPSSNDLLSSNAPNQLQISSSSVMGPPSAIVIAGQQGAVQSSTGEGAGPMYSQVYSQPTTQPPSQQQTQVPLEPDQQKALLQQVMNLTPEQIDSLPPEQRQQVLDLQQAFRSQMM